MDNINISCTLKPAALTFSVPSINLFLLSIMNWQTVKEYEDITYKKSNGVARIAFNRPDIRNAFRPKTVFELYEALSDAKEDNDIGVVLVSGEGPSPKDGKWAFCSGG